MARVLYTVCGDAYEIVFARWTIADVLSLRAIYEIAFNGVLFYFLRND
jgi:hypothetical protein